MTITTPPENSPICPECRKNLPPYSGRGRPPSYHSECFSKHRAEERPEDDTRFDAKWGKQESQNYDKFIRANYPKEAVRPPRLSANSPLAFPAPYTAPPSTRPEVQENLSRCLGVIQREIALQGAGNFTPELVPSNIPLWLSELVQQEQPRVSPETKRLILKYQEVLAECGEPMGSQRSLGTVHGRVYSRIYQVEKGWSDLGEPFHFVKAAERRANFLRGMSYYLMALHLLEYLAAVIRNLDRRGDTKAIKALRFSNTLWRLRIIATYLNEPDKAGGLMTDLGQLAFEVSTHVTWAEYWRTRGTYLTSQYEHGDQRPDTEEIDFCFEQAEAFLQSNQVVHHEMRRRAVLESLSALGRRGEATRVVEEYVTLSNFRLHGHSLHRIKPLAEQHGYRVFLRRNKFSTFAAFGIPYHSIEPAIADVPLLG